MEQEVRVRFAPSPTGVLHIGGVRTALYNYLFAKQTGGKMILRIEDTDQSRYVANAEDYINESLGWCGIEVDESVIEGGPHAPYRQSERKAIYKEHVDRLVNEGKAYYAFDTPEELDEMREKLKAAKANSLNYNSITRNTMKNSLTLSSEEVEQRINSGEPYVIRIKIPKKEDVRLNDMIRGWVMVHSSTMDDKVLMKSDGMPTYHLANVVDDHLMNITHVIRGEEWLPSAPLHVLLYRYLGWESTMPKFAHLPLLLKPDGNGKLSKRDAEKHGFPIFPLEWKGSDSDSALKGFREEGYLSEAFVNFISFLGWNPGTENELYKMNELIKDFSLERINKAGAKFDINKAIWFNQQYIREKPVEELAVHLVEIANANGFDCDDQKASAVAGLLRERIDVLPDLFSNGKYFFEAPTTFVEKVIRKKWNDKAEAVLNDFALEIGSQMPESSDDFQESFQKSLAKNDVNAGAVMQILRVGISGQAGGPDLMKIMEIIGASETKSRIDSAIEFFNKTSVKSEQEKK